MHKKSKNARKATKQNLISLQRPMSDTSDMSSSPNLLEKGDDNDSPDVDSGKDNNSTVVDGSGDDNSSWRKMSDMSSSSNLLNKDNEDDEVDALVNKDSSDEDKQEVPPKAQIVQKA